MSPRVAGQPESCLQSRQPGRLCSGPVLPDAPRAVLVADDEAILQRLITRVLERAGLEAVAVGDGDAALEAFEREPQRFAAVIVDVFMPPRGGGELLRKLLERRPDLGFVLTSGAELAPELRALLAERAGVFLGKPFAPEALLAAVRRALDGAGA